MKRDGISCWLVLLVLLLVSGCSSFMPASLELTEQAAQTHAVETDIADRISRELTRQALETLFMQLSFTPTSTPTSTPSSTPTLPPTLTATAASTLTATLIPTETLTSTPTSAPTLPNTATFTATATAAATATDTNTPEPTATLTSTGTASSTPQPTLTKTRTATATIRPTEPDLAKTLMIELPTISVPEVERALTDDEELAVAATVQSILDLEMTPSPTAVSDDSPVIETMAFPTAVSDDSPVIETMTLPTAELDESTLEALKLSLPLAGVDPMQLHTVQVKGGVDYFVPLITNEFLYLSAADGEMTPISVTDANDSELALAANEEMRILEAVTDDFVTLRFESDETIAFARTPRVYLSAEEPTATLPFSSGSKLIPVWIPVGACVEFWVEIKDDASGTASFIPWNNAEAVTMRNLNMMRWTSGCGVTELYLVRIDSEAEGTLGIKLTDGFRGN